MKYKLYMYKDSTTHDQHRWWLNFLDQEPRGWYDRAAIKEELAKYNAQWINCLNHYLEFDTEEDAVLFLVRWA